MAELSPADCERLYQPISGYEIRLLSIHPSADFDADIVCDLVVEDVTVDRIPSPWEEDQNLPITPYDALSYCWGGSAMTESIRCNGVLLPVTPTLLEALRYLRRPDTPRLLWTDSCCIHQADLEEKSRQVQMMFSIFQRAASVVAWVGTPSPADELLCRIIDVDADEQYPRLETNMNLLGMPMKAYMQPGETDPHHTAAVSAARTFITTRPFFQRTWIRQEIFAARTLRLICGRYNFPFKNFTEIVGQLLPEHTTDGGRFVTGKPDDNGDDNARALQCYSYFALDHDKLYTITSINLHSVWFHNVMRSAMYKSSLPHDKVFAVLGMSSWQTSTAESGSTMPPDPDADITRGFPAPDYTKPASVVFQEFVKHHINVSQTLRCLSIFQDRSRQDPNLPSWTVDLRLDTPRYLSTQQLSCWGIEWEDEIPRQRFSQHGILPLRGILVARLGRQTDAEPDPWAESYPREAMLPPSPMLQGCNDSEEHWFPEEDYENDNPDAPLDQTLQLLQRDCGYTWMPLGEHLAPIVPQEDSLQWPGREEFHHHALVSEAAREGDVVVHLGGADVACVLRPAGGEGKEQRWTFLGPALLAVGVFNREMVRDGKPVFQHYMARVDDEELDRKAKARKFVLV